MRKTKHGVTEWKVDQAWAGYTLFNPMIISRKQLHGDTTSKIYLIDMTGRIVHYWTIPGAAKLHGELLENGNLLCSIDIPGTPRPLKTQFGISSIVELDWDSNIVWQYDEPLHDCHDRCRLQNGNTLIMRYDDITQELQDKIQGGDYGTEIDGKMHTLTLEEIDPKGNVVWDMKLSDALDPEIDLIRPYCTRELWPGLNSIQELADGNIVSTSYNLSTVYIWDRKNKSVKWRSPKELVSFPHDPQPTKKGNIMVFDNGRYYVADPDNTPNHYAPDFSRVIEVNPETNEVIWEYRGKNPVDFYSTYISSSQPLPNGNVLVCEGATGYLFEVTRDKQVVWEYFSPFYSETGNRFGYTSSIFRAHRYSMDHPAFQDKVFDLPKMERINALYGPDAMKFANEV